MFQRLSQELPFQLACRATDTMCIFILSTGTASAPAVCRPVLERPAGVCAPGPSVPRGPEHSAACCLQKEERKNGTAPPPSGQEKWQERPLPFLSARV